MYIHNCVHGSAYPAIPDSGHSLTISNLLHASKIDNSGVLRQEILPPPPPPREYHRNLPEGFVYRSVGVWNRLHTCSLDYYIYIYLQAILDNKLDICCACIYLLSKITWNPRTYLILINRYILCSVHAAFFPGHPHPIIISLSTLQGHKYVWYQHLSERVDPPAVEII